MGTPLANVDGLKPKVAAALVAAGHTDSDDVAALSDEQLAEISGIGPAAIENIRSAIPHVSGDEGSDDGDEGDEPEDAGAADADEAEEEEGEQPAETSAPRPDPRPRPEPRAKKPAPPGCQWIRLRKGVRQITTEARINRTGELVQVRLFEGVRYPMPPDVQLGAVDRWHPMIVKENRQADWPAIKLSEVAVELWSVSRAKVSHFLAAAQSVIERYTSAKAAAEVALKGPRAVLERYNALREVNPDEIPAISAQVFDPTMPPGCLEIDMEEMADLQDADALCDPETGKSFATRDDLLRFQAEQQRRRNIPEELRRILDANAEAAILRVNPGDVL